MKHWYLVRMQRAHCGTGRSEEKSCCIFAENIIQVLNRYKRIPGIKTRFTPNISQLSAEDSSKLEREINNNGVSLDRVKATWYYSDDLF